MTTQKLRWSGLLRKRIYLNDAPPRGLRAALGAPADESDIRAHHWKQFCERWAALDKLFGLDSGAADIWNEREKALIEYKYGVRRDDPLRSASVAIRMACLYVPAFSIKRPNAKKHGAPCEWTPVRLAELFADVNFLQRKHQLSIVAICKALATEAYYAPRWKSNSPAALRKAYSQAWKRYREDFLFKLILCGADATIPANCVNPISAAIELHALKI